MPKIPIALQLYSVRHDLDRDLRGTLRAVAEMGYAGVEFAGAPQHTAQELKPLLDEFGLACCGWHTPFALVQEDTLAATIALNQALDNPNVIVPGIPALFLPAWLVAYLVLVIPLVPALKLRLRIY